MPGYIRIACAVPAVRVGDVMKNAADVCGYIEDAAAQNVDLLKWLLLKVSPRNSETWNPSVKYISLSGY